MQIKVGTDLVAIKRVEIALEKFGEKFLDRFLNGSEKVNLSKIESIAGYWAAKEAIAKALGCGIGKELSFLDIEIFKDGNGAPYFHLKKSPLKLESSSLSISHDGGFAIAVAALVINGVKK